MTVSEWINYGASIFTTVCGLGFMITYTVMARWYANPVGRMMMVYAGSVTGLALISVVFYTLDIDVEWIRVVRGGLIFLVGTVMCYQAATVLRVQLKNRSKAEEKPS